MNALARVAPISLPRPARPKVRHLWLVPGLALGLYAGAMAEVHHVGLVVLLAFGIAPHLPIVLGLGHPSPRGELAPRAVPLFDALHEPLLPAAILGLAAAGLLAPIWLVASLTWLGHVVVDWGLGGGLHRPDGSRLGISVLDPRRIRAAR